MDGSVIVSETRLGRVVAVSGSQAILLLEHDRAVDTPPPQVQVATLVKLRAQDSTLFGVVTGLNIPLPDPNARQGELELVEVELIGEVAAGNGTPRFQRGVSRFPALGDSIYAATQDDLGLVYACPSAAATRIGTIHQDRSLPAYVLTDELLGKHFAILGTTGTGKSCAVALILRTVLAQHENGHVVLLDIHNEYAHAFRDTAVVLDPATFQLPYWLMTFEEIEEILLSGSTNRDVESPILAELILEAKRLFAGGGVNARYITVDTPTPYRLPDLARIADQSAGSLDKKRDAASYMRIKSRYDTLAGDPRFAFMFPATAARDNLEAILSQLFRIPVAGKPMTIVDLSSVPSEVLNVVVSVLCRMTFDFALWSERSVPILLVCEEAHRYCPTDGRVDFAPTKRALSRIAKEGRKYGVSLCLVSQRPSELASGVLSQCNTIFALRMTSSADHEFVRSAMRESAMGLLDFLPALRNAEAIAIGEGVPVPVRLCFDELPEAWRPLSGSARFSTAWEADVTDSTFLGTMIERWRRERR